MADETPAAVDAADSQIEQNEATRIVCTECHFDRTVSADGADCPATIVIEHGHETGHILRVRRIEG